MDHDNVYKKPKAMIIDFAFDESVARVFPDMIRRSVPGYETIIALIGLLSEQYAQNNSNIYDLGCSLGAATLSIRRCLKHEECHIIAVDNAEAMVHRCKENIAIDSSSVATEVIQSDIQDIEIQNASVVVLNFSLQFIDPDRRLALLKRIHKGLNANGILIISDKIVFDDETEQRIQDDLHHVFKKANDYSELEISQKRSALENVLIPDTLPLHLQRLNSAGFAHSHVWFQCFNFVSLIAFK